MARSQSLSCGLGVRGWLAGSSLCDYRWKHGDHHLSALASDERLTAAGLMLLVAEGGRDDQHIPDGLVLTGLLMLSEAM